MKMNLQIKSFQASDEGEGIFEAYANVKWFKDHAADVTVDNAFINSIAKCKATGRMPKMLFNHDHDKVIGVWLEMDEDEHGLKVKGQLAMNTSKGREVYELLKLKALDALSIGYITVSENYDPSTNTNFLVEVDIREISVVTFPCNEASLVSSVKSDEPEIEPEKSDINNIVADEQEPEKSEPETTEDETDEEEKAINAKLDAFLLNQKLDAFLAAYNRK
ncbi:HK97 family phage prohead protease [Aeromonas veronii]|uniref:HK97 family phage prohead protease n=1 Tax=Aeromonas veronii TaxID=654 RepID=UPI003D19461C